MIAFLLFLASLAFLVWCAYDGGYDRGYADALAETRRRFDATFSTGPAPAEPPTEEQT